MFTVGLYLQIDPDSFDLVVPEIQSMPHIEVEVMEEESGKLLVSVSGDSESEDKQLIDAIKSLPFVMAAEIIYFQYYNDDDTGSVVSSDDAVDKADRTYKSYNFIVHTQH